jgi:Protein of unknown function (DUF3617)
MPCILQKFSATLLIGAWGACAMAQVALQPGEWEVSASMQGAPSGGGVRSHKVCLDAAKLSSAPEATLLESAPKPNDAPALKCSYDDMKRDGARSSWAAACEGPRGPMNGNGSATLETERAELIQNFEVTVPIIGKRKMQQSVSARRLGNCS